MRALIVDDHLMFREAIKRVCNHELHLSLVEEASSGEEALQIFQRSRPNLILLDLNLPGQSGYAVASQLSQESPAPDIVIISAHCTEFSILQLSNLPLRGFIDKNSSSLDCIKSAVGAIRTGTHYFSESYIKMKLKLQEDPPILSTMISDRELELLPFIAKGLDDLEIGQKIGIAQNTAKKHRLNILAKFNLESTPKLMAHLNQIGFAPTTN